MMAYAASSCSIGHHYSVLDFLSCYLPAFCLLVAFLYLTPVHHIPPGIQIVWTAILILEVVGMLPHIVTHNRERAICQWTVLIGGRGYLETAILVQNQPCPAG